MERNPYSPPEAVVADLDAAPSRRRPIGVWVILVLYAWNTLSTGSVVVQSFHRTLGLPSAEIRFYEATGLPRSTFAFLSGILSLMVVIQLYRLKRSAAYFITACLAVSVFSWYCVFVGMDNSEQSLAGALVIGCAFELIVVGYVWYIWYTRVLK